MQKLCNTTPRQDGFSMPGEFEKHAGCWILWPERSDNWRLGAKPAQRTFVEVAKAISQFEPVTVGVNQSQYNNARTMLPEHIRVVEMSNDDSWIRDCGATFVRHQDGEVRAVSWGFNAWGGLVDGLYFPWDKDQQVSLKMADMEGKAVYKFHEFIIEGGSIHVDGEGTLITTEECLLSEGRNPHLTKEQIEENLKNYVGVDKIIWLKRGIYNDETNGHVDNICCFVKPGEVLLAWTDNQDDPQYEISEENYRILMNSTDAKGRPLTVHKLHVPQPVLITDEESRGGDGG